MKQRLYYCDGAESRIVTESFVSDWWSHDDCNGYGRSEVQIVNSKGANCTGS